MCVSNTVFEGFSGKCQSDNVFGLKVLVQRGMFGHHFVIGKKGMSMNKRFLGCMVALMLATTGIFVNTSVVGATRQDEGRRKTITYQNVAIHQQVSQVREPSALMFLSKLFLTEAVLFSVGFLGTATVFKQALIMLSPAEYDARRHFLPIILKSLGITVVTTLPAAIVYGFPALNKFHDWCWDQLGAPLLPVTFAAVVYSLATFNARKARVGQGIMALPLFLQQPAAHAQ